MNWKRLLQFDFNLPWYRQYDAAEPLGIIYDWIMNHQIHITIACILTLMLCITSIKHLQKQRKLKRYHTD